MARVDRRDVGMGDAGACGQESGAVVVVYTRHRFSTPFLFTKKRHDVS